MTGYISDSQFLTLFTGNCISKEGLAAFQVAIQYQDVILSDTPKTQGTGLMRLMINVGL